MECSARPKRLPAKLASSAEIGNIAAQAKSGPSPVELENSPAGTSAASPPRPSGTYHCIRDDESRSAEPPKGGDRGRQRPTPHCRWIGVRTRTFPRKPAGDRPSDRAASQLGQPNAEMAPKRIQTIKSFWPHDKIWPNRRRHPLMLFRAAPARRSEQGIMSTTAPCATPGRDQPIPRT